MSAKYDQIGLTYADLRRPDARIGALIDQHLGAAETVLNVGAGAGNYEPQTRRVTALEPSATMIAQRRHGAEAVLQGTAEALPFDDDSFDAAMASLTVHHWSDLAKGLSEMRRVTRGPIVILTFDPNFAGIWLNDYFPALATLDDRNMPALDAYAPHVGPVDIHTVPIPHDCTDGFLYAYWRRPAAYLDTKARTAMSSFHALGDVSEGLKRLETDLTSGRWHEQNADLLTRDTLDCGYRLIVTR